MDRMLYTAMSGAQRSLAAQDVASHNLANLSTTGFREMLTLSRAVDVQGEGLATRVSSQLTTAGASMAQGTIQTTDRALDVALDGPGMLAVQGANGEELYTRNGALQIDADGVLTSGGLPVLGDGGPIELPLNAIVHISADGSVSARSAADAPDTMVLQAQLKLVNPEAIPGSPALVRGEDGYFRQPPTAAGEAAPPLAVDPLVRVVSGVLESSNVSATDAMVAMINNARSFEMQMKSIDTAERMAERGNSLLGTD